MAEKRKRSCFSKCCTTVLVTVLILFVLLAGGCAVGLVFADKFLKSNYDVGVWDCWQLITGLLNTDSRGTVTDPADSNDEKQMYSELKKVLFLNENADLKGVVDGYLESITKTQNDEALLSGTDGDSEENTAADELLGRITELYADGNVDLTRLRNYIENNTDIDLVYDTEFIAKINGNGLAETAESIICSVLEQNAETADFAGYLSVCQMEFSKNGDAAKIAAVAKVRLREALSGKIDDALNQASGSSAMPDFVVSMIKSFIPVNFYVRAEISLSEPVSVSVRVNNVSESTMNKMFAVLSKVSGEDVMAGFNSSLEELVAPLRESTPVLFDILGSADSDGNISLDAYGLLAGALSENKPADKQVDGKELASFLVGALGSDEENAINQRIESNPEFGEADWRYEQACSLVAAMSEVFALADSYFVNGTDEDGNKILSVDNGMIVGADKIIGRVYSDAAGQLYYKKSGSKFKMFVSGDKQVSCFNRSGYETFYSTGLHYTSGGKEYVLYKSGDGKTIYGINGADVQDKNGTYTELTTIYADNEGNVYSRQNAGGTLIEITKEKLTVDTVFNIVDGGTDGAEKLLDLIDFSALRLSGTSQWLNPVKITDAQLASMIDEVIARYISEEMLAAEPEVAYVEISGGNSTDYVTLGLTMNLAAMMPEEYRQLMTDLTGEKCYVEVKCDVTLDKEEGTHAPVEIRYNDLSGGYTADMLETVSKIAADFNITGELENVAREIRSTIASLNDQLKIRFVGGGIEIAAPASIIIPLITDKTVDAADFVGAIDLLLKSDSYAAVALAESLYPEFASDDWTVRGINSLAVNLAEAFILQKEKFLSDDMINYSLDKIMDIMENDNFSIDDIEGYLDYETMKSEGFGNWKNNFAASDLAVAAIVDSVKDESFAEFAGANPEIEYVHVYSDGDREFVSVAVSLKLKSLLDGNHAFGRILDVLDEYVYVEITLDVTGGTDDYAQSELKINDLTTGETDRIFDVISLFDDGFSKEGLFGEIENQVRASLDSIRAGIDFTFGEGEVLFTAPQDIIYGAIIETPSADFTAEEMTDALTAFATSSNSIYEQNGGFVADVSSDVQSEKFWNDTLKEKYFMTIGAGQLFASLTGGEDVYGTVINAIDKNLFAPGGIYAHADISDAKYKADNTQLSWLFRSNSAAMAEMFGSSVMNNVEIYSTVISGDENSPEVSMTITVPAADLISYMGDLDASVKNLIANILPEKTALEIKWSAGNADAYFTVSGMSPSSRDAVGKLIEKITGIQIFGSGSEIADAAQSAHDYFEDYFEYGIENGEGYACVADFYKLIADNVFAPEPGKEPVTESDVYELMKTLYELPETNGVFDSARLGYESVDEEVAAISAYVQDASYTVAGAKETIEASLVNPEAKLITTVKYVIDVTGDAKKVLPDKVYITVNYDAHPVITQTGVDVSNSEITERFNLADDAAAVKKCLAYLDVDVDAAVSLAHTQLNEYIMSLLSFGL